MKEKTISLFEPIVVGGNELHEVTIRRGTVGDEEDAMDMAIRLKRQKNAVTVEVCLIAKLTKLPYDVVRGMYGQDYTALREALSELNGFSANPTMTPETEIGMPENDLTD
jgi:tryptophan 2,3-dioxygenase